MLEHLIFARLVASILCAWLVGISLTDLFQHNIHVWLLRMQELKSGVQLECLPCVLTHKSLMHVRNGSPGPGASYSVGPVSR